jgi:hypothetical protein
MNVSSLYSPPYQNMRDGLAAVYMYGHQLILPQVESNFECYMTFYVYILAY